MAKSYALQKCPACSKEFAVQTVEVEGRPSVPKLARCLYCSHDSNNFWTASQIAEAKRAAGAAVKAILAGNKASTTSSVTLTPESTDRLKEHVEFACCAGSALHDGSTEVPLCPYWGHTDPVA